MTVSVTPDRFLLVDFDAELIERIATELAGTLGLHDQQITIAVDEQTLLGRIRVQLDDDGPHIVVLVESGAFEDSKHSRRQSERATRYAIGWALLRARDRMRGGFAEAPPDEELSNRQRSAWNAYLAGRLHRQGVDVGPQRWRYDFRNRHGFSDSADEAFERLWAADCLDWSTMDAVSGRAARAGGS